MDENEKKKIKKISILIMIFVLMIFAVLCVITGIIGKHFGNTVENIIWICIAVVLAIMLYRSKRS